MTEPKWLTHARTYLGTAEITGKDTAPVISLVGEIKSWWRTMNCRGAEPSSRRIPGVGHAGGETLVQGEGLAELGAAIGEPALGCVVVYERGGGGHVGFVVGTDILGRMMTLGGNQGNRVSIAPFDPLRVVGYRWPEEGCRGTARRRPATPIKSNGQSSTGGSMTIKSRAALAGRFILARLSEPSTIKGLLLAVSALGWWKMDNSSQGEGIAQMGMLIVGIINAALPQSTLYQEKGNVR